MLTLHDKIIVILTIIWILESTSCSDLILIHFGRVIDEHSHSKLTKKKKSKLRTFHKEKSNPLADSQLYVPYITLYLELS